MVGYTSGSVADEGKRSGDSDGRAVLAIQVVMEERALMVGKARSKDKERKKSDVPGPAREVSESDGKESEWSGAPM